MFLADYHLHSSFSGDSDECIHRIFQKAHDLGLQEIAITDHVDPEYPSDDVIFNLDLSTYIQTIDEFRKIWKGKLDIVTGLELGLQQHLEETLQCFLSDPSLDFIIGSIHCADRGDFVDETFFEGKDKIQAHRRYFETIYENLKIYDGFSVLGHLDYIKRYGRKHYGKVHSELDYSLHMDVIDEILKLAVSKGIGLEANTSGFRYGLGHPHPDSVILSRYLELGGEIITIGSDAHRTEDIGSDFRRCRDLLENLGFRYICGFRKKEPLFYPLANIMFNMATDL
jgi:histidinol-phosphatase (PHP family)